MIPNLEKVCEISDIKDKGFYVYKGLGKKGVTKGKIKYIGTTTQIPSERFRWHEAHGKNLDFQIIAICKDKDEMLDLEFRLIRHCHPSLNKISDRKQNLNTKLTEEELESRKGNPEWCQCCLKRRVNKGYIYCYYCSHDIC